MELLKWNDEQMSTGLETIDTQHKKLIKIINDLTTAINKNEENEVLFDIVDSLIEYTQYHFTTEEELFEKFDFEDSSLHKSEHKYFIEHFKAIKKGLEKDAKLRDKSIIALSEDILAYLKNWFFSHITGSDRDYIDLFKKNGVS